MEEEEDIEVEEEKEEEVDEEQERADEEARQESERLPAWTRNLDPSTKQMPTEGLLNIDMSDGAAQIFDNSMITKILQMFSHYHRQRVMMSPKAYYEAMIKNEIGRPDLDGICPYDVEDADGNLKYPSEGVLRKWFDDRANEFPWSDEPMFGGRPWDYMHPIINLLMDIEKMMQFLVEAGFKAERLQFLVPMNKMKGTNEEKAQMRNVVSNFFSRVLKGTFPEKKHYTYFRNDDEGFEDVIHIAPIVVYLAHRDKQRNDELLITARQSSITLPAGYQKKIDFTMAYAASEASRGKTERITNLAPNLETSVTKAAIENVGGTMGAREGMAAAAKAANAPLGGAPKAYAPRPPPPAPAASSSSSSSVPIVHVSTSTASVPKRPEAKPMPTTAPTVTGPFCALTFARPRLLAAEEASLTALAREELWRLRDSAMNGAVVNSACNRWMTSVYDCQAFQRLLIFFEELSQTLPSATATVVCVVPGHVPLKEACIEALALTDEARSRARLLRGLRHGEAPEWLAAAEQVLELFSRRLHCFTLVGAHGPCLYMAQDMSALGHPVLGILTTQEGLALEEPPPLALGLKVTLEGLSGDINTVAAARDWTVGQLKDTLGSERHEVRLLLPSEATELRDEERLSSLLVEDATHLLLRLLRVEPRWASALQRVKNDAQSWRDLEEDLKADRGIALLAVAQEGWG
eukprot:s2607_g2.t1